MMRDESSLMTQEVEDMRSAFYDAISSGDVRTMLRP